MFSTQQASHETFTKQITANRNLIKMNFRKKLGGVMQLKKENLQGLGNSVPVPDAQ